MRFLTLLFTVAAVLPGILAGPAALPVGVQIEVYPGETTGKHIVTLKDGASKDAIVARVGELLAGKPGTGITDHYDTIFSGFAGEFRFSPGTKRHRSRKVYYRKLRQCHIVGPPSTARCRLYL
jgi:hypothetical protein